MPLGCHLSAISSWAYHERHYFYFRFDSSTRELRTLADYIVAILAIAMRHPVCDP